MTLPAMMLLGVLVGARRRATSPAPIVRSSATARTLALGALTLWLCAFALSASRRRLAASKAAAALVRASSARLPAACSSAQSSAPASDLDPLSDAGPRVEATIALHRGRLARSRAYLMQAVGRDPTDVQAWAQLGQVDALMGNARGVERVARRLVALDPRGPWVQVLQGAHVLSAPTADSVRDRDAAAGEMTG